MDQRFRWMTLVAMVLIAIGVGTVAYNAGVSHGLVVSAPAAPGAGAAPGSPVYYYGHRPWGWGFGFFPFGILLWIFVLRLLFWGGGRRWWYHRHGPYGPFYEGDTASFDEWHRRAHERMTHPPRE